MGAVLAVAAKDLRQRLRDRSAPLVGIVIPFTLAAVFSLTSGEIDLDGRYLLVDEGTGELGTAFLEGPAAAIRGAELGNVTPTESRLAAAEAVRDGRADAAIVLPGNLRDRLAAGEGAEVRVLVPDEQTFETLLAETMARSFVFGIETTRLIGALVAARGTGSPPPGADGGTGTALLGSEVRPIALRQLDSTAALTAGMAIFFVAFTVQFAFVSLHTERRQGTFARMMAAPINPAAVLAGKALVGAGLGVVTVTILVIAGRVLLGVEWGPPAGVALLIVASVVAMMGIMAIAAAVAKTQAQANAAGMIVAIVLGLLGGSFFPTGLGPSYLARLSLVAPHAWWIRGLGDLAPPSASAMEAADEAAVLMGIGLVTGTIAVILARRMFRP